MHFDLEFAAVAPSGPMFYHRLMTPNLPASDILRFVQQVLGPRSNLRCSRSRRVAAGLLVTERPEYRVLYPPHEGLRLARKGAVVAGQRSCPCS